MQLEFCNFKEFYPFYLSQHQNLICRRLHLLGITLGLISLLTVISLRNWLYLPLPLVLGYGCAWIGHFFFEKNKPATFNYPLWSLRGDFAMVKDMLTGQIEL
ncbi:DUF962 domain-containing protein [Acaryochloris sp. CCMEE 5410]|uniref:DUF962 domain-containing protein n=1 Tax=Acaryochloris sp. CCMEE 5410 TaxID=310037 RepID=UPI0002485266|nr:DUF962 domain-containing protein [Acaryochloris sp. CCMEE 5410]KAI9135122.1 DUF962 domain-containing protein [Acaryochloris sp. CCMEE 5410]